MFAYVRKFTYLSVATPPKKNKYQTYGKGKA